MTERVSTGKKATPIFLLHSCDTAGENRRLMLATVRRMRLKKACVQAIHNDLFEYHCGEAQNKAQQLKRFRKDFETLPVEELNRRLRFGVLTMCYDGEEI